jgi:hypothetical protein
MRGRNSSQRKTLSKYTETSSSGVSLSQNEKNTNTTEINDTKKITMSLMKERR